MSCFLNCVAGLPDPVFLVTYDAPSDELRIAVSPPIFVGITGMGFTGTPSSGAYGPGGFTIVDSSHIVIPAASDSGPSELTGLEFFVGADLIGAWSGSVEIPPPITNYPLLTGIFSPAVDQVAFTGLRFQTAIAGGITHLFVRLESYANAGGCFDGPKMGVNLDIAPISDWVVEDFTDTLILLSNPRFSSCTPDDAAVSFTVNGMALSAPNFGTPPGDGYDFYEPWGVPSPYFAVIDGTTPVP